MKDIAIFGAGGFGREVACLINRINEDKPIWNLIGFFDDDESLKGKMISHFGTCLGNTEDLNKYDKELSIVISVGSPKAVKAIANKIINPNIDFPNIIAPSVNFLDIDTVKIGKGNIFCMNCMISCDVTIGDFNLFNGHIPIGHDVKIGNYNVIMPSVNISGGVEMGETNFLGVQSVVLQYIKIGNEVRVGANSVIMRNTKDGFLYLGNPAKKIEL